MPRPGGFPRHPIIFVAMPVIVVGADTDAGESILEELTQPGREVRVFVSDAARVDSYRSRGLKVALGDVSDDSHVWGAATRCFSAVLIAEAADDARERSFAATPEAVLEGWADAVTRAGVKRVIWVASDEPPATPGTETAIVRPDDPALASRVSELDDAQSIG